VPLAAAEVDSLLVFEASNGTNDFFSVMGVSAGVSKGVLVAGTDPLGLALEAPNLANDFFSPDPVVDANGEAVDGDVFLGGSNLPKDFFSPDPVVDANGEGVNGDVFWGGSNLVNNFFSPDPLFDANGEAVDGDAFWGGSNLVDDSFSSDPLFNANGEAVDGDVFLGGSNLPKDFFSPNPVLDANGEAVDGDVFLGGSKLPNAFFSPDPALDANGEAVDGDVFLGGSNLANDFLSPDPALDANGAADPVFDANGDPENVCSSIAVVVVVVVVELAPLLDPLGTADAEAGGTNGDDPLGAVEPFWGNGANVFFSPPLPPSPLPADIPAPLMAVAPDLDGEDISLGGGGIHCSLDDSVLVVDLALETFMVARSCFNASSSSSLVLLVPSFSPLPNAATVPAAIAIPPPKREKAIALPSSPVNLEKMFNGFLPVAVFVVVRVEGNFAPDTN
jgi:hypothetical protein